MNSIKFSILAILSIILSFNSCSKEKVEISGSFLFSEISSSNSTYGFVRENGAAVTIPTSEIDYNLFDECEQAHFFDYIEIISETKLKYTALDLWNNTENSTIKESDYTLTRDEDYEITTLAFEFLDEFGNDSKVLLEYKDNLLILHIYVLIDEWSSSLQPISYIKDQPKNPATSSKAESRLSSDEGDKIYMMVYTQKYTKN